MRSSSRAHLVGGAGHAPQQARLGTLQVGHGHFHPVVGQGRLAGMVVGRFGKGFGLLVVTQPVGNAGQVVVHPHQVAVRLGLLRPACRRAGR
jgi:hypothetical protein